MDPPRKGPKPRGLWAFRFYGSRPGFHTIYPMRRTLPLCLLLCVPGSRAAAGTAAGQLEALAGGVPAAEALPAPEAPYRDELGPEYDDPVYAGDELARLAAGRAERKGSTGELGFIERRIVRIMARAHAKGKLVPALERMLSSRLMQRFIPAPPAKKQDYIKKFPRMVAAQLEGTGLVEGTEGFEAWEAMSRRHIALVTRSAFAPPAAGGPSLLAEPGFLAELEALAGVPFRPGNEVSPLVDGPASFAERERLISAARESVHLMVWGWYDDLTGGRTADLLIAGKRKGLDVKVMVDGNISNFIGMASLKAMEEAGIEVARFSDPARAYDGMHAKLLVVDGEYAVTGGMNVGDKYSHMDPAAHKWRDTDAVFSGPAAGEAARVFAENWNEQAAVHGLSRLPEPKSLPAEKGQARAALVYQRADREPAIYLSLLKAMYGASSRINIENAYFVTIPSLRTALTDALARGVKVTILSNSASSNNEPILTGIMMESLAEMAEAGADVYVREGETLHSKFMTVDGEFATVGSYNFHPKSIRHEREITLHVADRDFAASLEGVFLTDLGSARRITDAAELGDYRSPLNFIARRYMFSQL